MVKTLQFWGVFNCRGEDSMGIGKVAGDTAFVPVAYKHKPYRNPFFSCFNADGIEDVSRSAERNQLSKLFEIIFSSLVEIELFVIFQHANHIKPFLLDFANKGLICKPCVHKDIACLYSCIQGIANKLQCSFRFLKHCILAGFVAVTPFIYGCICLCDPFLRICRSHHIETYRNIAVAISP